MGEDVRLLLDIASMIDPDFDIDHCKDSVRTL